MIFRCPWSGTSHFSRYLPIARRSLKPYSGTQIRHSSQSPPRVIFSGIQPTGTPHLGNYLGALKPWVELQQEPESTRLYYCIVDLHAITVSQSPQQLRIWRKETLAALLAVGLDPKRCTIFYQSDVSLRSQLPERKGFA